MANQVVTVLETTLPSDPDIAQLSQMQAPIVMVHKITRGEKGKELTQLVINGLTGLALSDILKLQDVLPLGTVYQNSGPGVYRFSVTDGDSAAKCSWQTRLGGAVAETPASGMPTAALPFGTPPTAAAVHAAAAAAAAPFSAGMPLSATARPIGNGFFYDEALGLLTAPDMSIHAWRKGQPLPGLVTATLPASTPVSQLAGPGVPFFAPSPELEATRLALAQSQRALEESQRQREQEQREATQRREQEQRDTEHRREMGELREMVKQSLARPAENPEVADLRRRLERQDEMAAMRTESKATTDAILALVREQGQNRGVDPMINMLTGLMQQGQQASTEMIRMMRETAGAERQTLLTVLDKQSAAAERTAANNPFEKLASGFDVLMDRMGKIMQIEREFSGSGGGVDWISVLKAVGSQAGSALQTYQAAKAEEAKAAEAGARAQIATAQASISRDRTLVAVRGGKAAPPRTQRPAPAAAPAAPAPAAPGSFNVPLPDLEKATLPELREVFGPERDEVFFGSFFDHVKQLRAAVAATPSDFSARKIAELLMQARAFIVEEAQAGRTPHAAEIWAHSQTGYLLERLLPEASEGLRSEINKVLVQLQAEEEDAQRIAKNAGESEEGEEDS